MFNCGGGTFHCRSKTLTIDDGQFFWHDKKTKARAQTSFKELAIYACALVILVTSASLCYELATKVNQFTLGMKLLISQLLVFSMASIFLNTCHIQGNIPEKYFSALEPIFPGQPTNNTGSESS